ncbi:efflux RND transporter periplasmic adaptor subunit [Moritella sp.]|uniref:efflux RND transporter periplasmic adaptor subunit n=1 Tax=Moritella sp. TaxID=78556 RepID=UPI001D9F80E7|nr:efflux RND transporter periplasmic adaptor subunit [Moritella sp.]MCJ8351271.1 efflux RND transporter periplasmic adaptor subunit [Moritella sp.]NQZ41323.1 efflux RND transporter periplasmic adaptor subunit [Moritella sp.]
MNKFSSIVIALSAITILQGCEQPIIEPRQKIQLVKIETVQLAEDSARLSYPAVAVAADKSSLSFRLQGEVTSVTTGPGERVTKGQILAQIDPTYYRLEVDDAKAEYAIADSQYRRSAKLVDQGYIAPSQFDELKAQRRIAKARLDIAKLNLSFTELKAPFSGVISHVPIQQFENVQVGQQVMNIYSTTTVDIQLQAPDIIYSQSSAVEVEASRPGAKVITADGMEYEAHLKEFTTEPDPKVGSFVITLTMPMPKDKFILDGMAVEVRADAQKLNIYKKNEPFIPLEAILNEDGDDLNATQKFVWVVNSDLTVSKRQVVTDKVMNEGVRLSSGLAVGEKVVVAGGNRLREGQSVKIFDESMNNSQNKPNNDKEAGQ